MFPLYRGEPNFADFRKVLFREGEPQRVPFYELGVDGRVAQLIYGRPIRGNAERIEYQIGMGYSYVNAPVKGCAHPSTGALEAEDTAELGKGLRRFHVADMGCIKSWEDFEKYPWPKPQDFDYSPIEEMAKILPDGMKIIVRLGHVLEDPMGLMGYTSLSLALYDEPELVDAVFDRVGRNYEAAYQVAAQMDCVGALEISDDLGFKTSTMFSPDMLRRYVFPWYKRYCDICHSHGKPVILHSCGNLAEIMEDLIACGIDAKHSYEDQIMPVTEMKHKYGDRMAALGGIDMDLLCRGSEDHVRKRVREVLEACMPGGSYALGTGNTVANYVPVRSYVAMIDEGLRMGWY